MKKLYISINIFFISKNHQVVVSRLEPGLSDSKTYASPSAPRKLCYALSNHLEQKIHYTIKYTVVGRITDSNFVQGSKL